MTISREIRLKSRPEGLPDASHFELAEVQLPTPGEGQVLVRNTYMSVDPYMRGRMYDRRSYVPPFQIGEALTGGAVGKVITSNDAYFQPGDLVYSMFGWREAYVANASDLQKLTPIEGLSSSVHLGILGMPGMTAWAGFTQIGQPKAGETVFVSGAAGAVGSVVCQIAKLRGCTVIASAGTDAKGAWLKSLGVDHVINYRTTPDLLAAVQQAAPKGIDIYFDNVGGEHLEVAIETARPMGRLVECGMIANYNSTEPTPGPRNIMQIVGKGLKMQGFLVGMYSHLQAEFQAEMGEWVKQGKIQWEETIHNGIEKAPEAFIGLFDGSNTGKMLVNL